MDVCHATDIVPLQRHVLDIAIKILARWAINMRSSWLVLHDLGFIEHFIISGQ